MPDWAKYVRQNLRLSGLKVEREAEVIEDLAQQLGDAYAEALRSGLSPAQAEAAAEKHITDWHALAKQIESSKLGRESAMSSLQNYAEDQDVTRRGTFSLFTEFVQDIRFGLRMLRKNPGFTAVAVLTLAAGIGVNTGIFSVLDAVLLRSLPVSHPEQLALLTDPDDHGGHFGSQTGDRSLLAYSEFEYLRDQNTAFLSLFAADSSLPEVEVSISGASSLRGGGAETVRVRMVSGDYFSTLGMTPALGTVFGPEVDRVRGDSPIAVCSYAFWKRRFALNPSVLGTAIRMGSSSFQVVGIASPGFFGETVGEAPDLWVPLQMQAAVYPGVDYLSPSPQGIVNQHMWLQVMGRLKPGISLSQANAALNIDFKRYLESAIGSTLTTEERAHVMDQRLSLHSGSVGSSILRRGFGAPLQFLMVLVGLILLLACTNVANLLLARGAGRQKEFAMRLAIGAGRQRLIRQLVTESLLLASLGAVAGLFLAHWCDVLLLRMVAGASGPSSIQLNLQPDSRVLAFTLGAALLTAILFGLLPALLSTRLDLSPTLKANTSRLSGYSASRRIPIGKILVIAQVAVSLILLVAAGLFVRSLSRLNHADLGYERENLFLFRVDAAAAGFKGPAATHLYQELLERISAIPGLRGATVSHNGLFSHSESGDPISVEGYKTKPGEELDSRFDHVGPKYFSTVEIPLLMGREIEPQDSVGGVRAAVVNQTFVRQFFPNTNPLGKHVSDTYAGNPAEMVVVGVVADAKYSNLREKTPPRIYVPLFNPVWEQPAARYEVRTYADSAAVAISLRQAVKEVAGSLLPIEITSMSELVNESLETDRFVEQLSEAFGMLAMLLAVIGLYGIMAYTVARRTRDIGIRLALGAEPSGVLWQVLLETLLLVSVGIAIGVPVALAGTQAVRGMLYGVGFADPVAILFAAFLLAAAAALAGFLPARRAAKIDPIVALRYE
jgi:predicted permease